MATQGELISRIRDMLDEPSARRWSDQQLRRWINDGQVELARKTECNRDEIVIATSASLGQYTITENVVRLHLATWKADNDIQPYPVEFVDKHSMAGRVWAYESFAPTHASYWGQPPSIKMQLYPVPSQAGELTVYFYSFPDRLAEDDATDKDTELQGIPAGWEDMVVDYVEFRSLRQDRDPRWQEAFGLWATKISDLSHAASRYGDYAGQFDWNGNPAWLTNWDW